MLDGLSVAVPTGDVGGEVPALGVAFNDEVLEDLVEGEMCIRDRPYAMGFDAAMNYGYLMAEAVIADL